jgi:uroporphyrinogen decarboxylase
MQKRDVVGLVLAGKKPPYVPWSMGFTKEAKAKLQRHFGCEDIEKPLDNHILKLGSDIGFFTELGDNRVRDVFGAVWDRSIDKDIGNVEGQMLSPIRSIRGFSPIFPARSRNIPTDSAYSKSAFRFTSGRGRSAGWPV